MEEKEQDENLKKEDIPDSNAAGQEAESGEEDAGGPADGSKAGTAEEAADSEQDAQDQPESENPEPNANGGAGRTEDLSSDGDDAEKAGEKKGFFKKKKDKKDEQIEDLTDKHKRLMAEFENFRKRTEKEKSSMFEMGQKSAIEKILPVVDNFERGFATLSEEDKATPFAEGMDKVYRQLMTTLEGMDVHPIEAVGKEFDPNYHNAVMHIEDENFGENIVAQEFQKGYTYRDSVLRHSMVQVAN